MLFPWELGWVLGLDRELGLGRVLEVLEEVGL